MTKKEAIGKIQNHILLYGKRKNFTVSTRMIKYWWKILNIAIFENMLPLPKFSIRPIRGAFGECEGKYYIGTNGRRSKLEVVIHINAEKIFSRELFIAVLVHEMVHQWQFEYREDVIHEKRMSHGSTFTQWRVDIENIIGVKLAAYLDEDDVLANWYYE